MRKSKIRIIAALISMALILTDIVPAGFQVYAAEIGHEDSDANTDDSGGGSADAAVGAGEGASSDDVENGDQQEDNDGIEDGGEKSGEDEDPFGANTDDPSEENADAVVEDEEDTSSDDVENGDLQEENDDIEDGGEKPEEVEDPDSETFTGTDSESGSDIPEFVPGVIPEEYEMDYPSYDFPVSVADSYYDTRDLYQSSVKNQGSNGLCWSFGTYAALEANAKLHGYEELDFSEMHMAYSTSSSSGNTKQGWNRIPSSGGNRIYSTAYLMRGTSLSGTVDEKDDPYNTKLIEERDLSISESKEQTYDVQNVMFLTGGDKATDVEVSVIKWAVQTYGGVGASIYWKGQTTADDGEDIQPFYNASTASYFYDRDRDSEGKSGSNHMVEIAGWDDDYPISKFSPGCRPGKPGAWLIKNSWGANWGDDGYVWVSYEDTNFPLNAFCFDGIKPYDSSTIVYETDYKTSGAKGWSSITQGFFAKIYTAETDSEELQSVRIYVTKPYPEIEVDCITDFSGNNPWNGYTFSSKGSVKLDPAYPGWYTINLKEPVTLGAAGSQFAVVVKLKGGQGAMIGYDGENVSDTPAYCSTDGKNWAKDNGSYANYCIKAVTKPTASADQTVINKAANALTWDVIKGENTNQTEVRRNLTLPTSFNYGTTIDWESSAPSVVGTDGTVQRPVGDDDVSVTLTATVRKGSAEKKKQFVLTVINVPAADQAAVKVIADSITWDRIRGDNTDEKNVTSNLELITSSDQGATVTWLSTNTDIIGTDGTVTMARFDKINTVTLTAIVEKGEARQEIEFKLTVPYRAETSEDIASAVWDWLGGEYSYSDWWNQIRGNNQNKNSIRYDLNIPSEITFPMEKGGEYKADFDVATTYEKKSDGTKVNPWSYVSGTGEVTRPAFGEADSNGLVHLRVLYNGQRSSLASYTITVLAYKGTIKIDQQPEDKTVGTGITMRLMVNASQDEGGLGEIGNMAYQWYRAADADGKDAKPINGATDPILQTTVDMPDGEYYYYCEVSALDAAPVKTRAAQVSVRNVLYTVTFDPNGGDLTGSMTDSVIAGDVLTRPEDPAREGYVFTGWYKEETCEHLWDFEQDIVQEDIILYAGWVPNGLWIEGVDEEGYPYTGSAVKPDIKVYDCTTLLAEKTDYTISYKNNIKANAANTSKVPAITVTGKGNYSGKVTKTFKILPVDITQKDIDEEDRFEADDISVVYNGKAQKTAPVLYWDGKKLKNNTDYTVTYHEGKYGGTDTTPINSVKEPGDYYIKLDGRGNYTGTRILNLTVLPKATDDSSRKPISKATVAKIPNQSYQTEYKDGGITPEVTVKYGSEALIPDTHYTVSYSNNDKVGTAYAVIKGIEENGYSGTKRVSFKITGTAIKKATVTGLSGQDFIYNGTPIEPDLTLTLNGQEGPLTPGTDYEVTWQNNQSAGKATAVIKGKGGYTGSVKKTFKIKAFDVAANADRRFKAVFENDSEFISVPYAKGGAKPVLKVTFRKEDDTVQELTEGIDYTLTYKNNTAVSNESNAAKIPTVTVKGKGSFSGTYATNNLTYKITTQDIEMLNISAADRTFKDKKNNYAASVTITDINGKKLKAGTDYNNKTFTYKYISGATLGDGTYRDPGESVDSNDIIPAGTRLEVTVSGKGNYIGSIKGGFRITEASISGAAVSVPNQQTYTGQEIMLSEEQITVKIKGKKLDPDQYEIVTDSYKNNIRKGTASVTIRGVGNYGGTKTVKFKIVAKPFSLFSLDSIVRILKGI